VLYIHTKGVSRHPDELPRMTDWRRLMEYFNIVRFEDCIASLGTHDVCGVNWHTAPDRHFSGNFWWATCEYVAGLPRLSELWKAEDRGPNSRRACEQWLGTNPRVRAKSFHESAINHYLAGYPRSRYNCVREVDVTSAWHPYSAWQGLENRVQDILELVHPINRIVEIGVEYGYSLFSLSSAVPSAEVIGVDPYDTLTTEECRSLKVLGSQAIIGSSEAKAWVTAHLQEFPNARLLTMTGEDALGAVQGPIDILHIDAIHTFDAVEKDFRLWEPKLRRGGCVLFHDTVSFPNDVGRFFRSLPGRKVEFRECNGLGAWFKD
jgi:hypothetical protein